MWGGDGKKIPTPNYHLFLVAGITLVSDLSSDKISIIESCKEDVKQTYARNILDALRQEIRLKSLLRWILEQLSIILWFLLVERICNSTPKRLLFFLFQPKTFIKKCWQYRFQWIHNSCFVDFFSLQKKVYNRKKLLYNLLSFYMCYRTSFKRSRFNLMPSVSSS